MKLPRRRFLRLAAAAALLPTASRLAAAETYPSRPITMVVPFPAGGPTDTHVLLATVCGTVGAMVTVALLLQMDRTTTNSVGRQATISAVVTLIGDVFAHPSHFPPQGAEPLVTAAVSACIAVALWYAKRWARFAY